MKGLRSICLCILTFTTAFPAHAQLELPDALQGNPLKDKMVGETPDNPFLPIHSFDMEGRIHDGITGVQAQAVSRLTGVDGYVGRAIHFDGTSYAEVPIDLHPLSMPDMTIAMMVRADPLPEEPDELAAVPTSGYLFSDGDSFIILNNQKKSSAFLSVYSASALVQDSSMFQVPHGVWHMVAMSRKIEKRTNAEGAKTDHTVLKFYVNGRIQEKVAELKNVPAEPPVFTLGAISQGQTNTKLRGALDHMIIYDRALDKEELDEVRGRFSQAAGNEWLDSQGVTAQPIEASQALTDSIDGGIVGTGTEEVSEELTLGYDEVPPELLSRDESTDVAGLAGQDANATREAISEFSRNPQERLIREAEEERRRDAAADTAIKGSGLVSADSPIAAPTVQTADETQELIASAEGQELLQSADWRIEGMVPNSQDRSTLYPGDEVTLKIRVSKDDPANKIPSVRLVTNVGPGVPGPSYGLTINTAQTKSTDQRDVPITLPVPDTLDFDDDATQLVWRPKVWLNAQDGLPLLDATTDNNSKELALVVDNKAKAENCGVTSEDGEGTRTVTACLEEEDILSKIYIDHSVLVRPRLAVANSHLDDRKELLLFEEARDALRAIQVTEDDNKPCSIQIGGHNGGYLDSRHCGRQMLGSDKLATQTSTNEVITGIRVCRNLANNRLKGFQFQTRRVLSDGTLSLGTRDLGEESQTNCAKWSGDFAVCPTGSAAGGLEVWWNSGTLLAPGDFIHSLNLLCGVVKLQGEKS